MVLQSNIIKYIQNLKLLNMLLARQYLILSFPIIFTILTSSIGQAQTSFENFIGLFPKYQWQDLPADITTINNGVPVDINFANENMFGEHVSIRRKTINLEYSTKAPHIKISGEFKKYRGGYHGLYRGDLVLSNNQTYPSTLEALAKVEFENQFVLLLLHYKFYDLDQGWQDSYEAFTFRLTDRKMLSAINLADHQCMTFIERDRSITSYETHEFVLEIGDEYEEYESTCKIIYKIENDGYFIEHSFEKLEEKGLIYDARVSDPDGWANVRINPVQNSEVIYKALDGKYMYVEQLEDSNWCRVLSYQEDIDKIRSGGYIKLSRIKKLN